MAQRWDRCKLSLMSMGRVLCYNEHNGPSLDNACPDEDAVAELILMVTLNMYRILHRIVPSLWRWRSCALIPTSSFNSSIMPFPVYTI